MTYLVVKQGHEEGDLMTQLYTWQVTPRHRPGFYSLIPRPFERPGYEAMASKTFIEEYINNKVQGWTKDIMTLDEVALS